ncbi:TetR/AcrR family transcriptional regulator (plasmid) [Lichenicola cladoniae]|uniref:TetR/AcrR family transcriptional regulator n=2 Tax=Lichenicola cladoniae TaxID=1484109 RepID=A0A6M8HZL8_9PROT|nr:TetR/AcrR family transcriptional regulator [Acetobacteraceae bacterium]QKE93800.1 TetR/AcrR family transcriptional regulator [Lichenicola cladoniae]
MTGRPREFDREVALDAAMHLFWRKGFESASMTELCDAMRIRSPSLYAAYGSKEALYLEAINRYAATVGAALWSRLDDAESARAGVENMLMAAADMLPESADGPAGCMAMLAALSDDWPQAITDAARQMRDGSLERLRAHLAAGVMDGELPIGADVDGTARLFLGIYQGMAAQAKDGASSQQLRKVAERGMAAWPVTLLPGMLSD